MSRGLAHLLVAVLLAFSVPLQAFAAASAGICMGLGHHHSAGSDGHHDHEHGQPADSSSHCPPCSACCATSAIAPLEPHIVADGRSHVVNAAAPPLSVGIQTAVLDRPPLFS